MFWQETEPKKTTPVPEDVVDFELRIQCAALPVDHAYALFEALDPLIPWLKDEPHAGIHPIHVAETAHGWIRPKDPDALLHLSRRVRLVLRLPRTRIEDAKRLEGQTVIVAGNALTMLSAETRPLRRSTTLFARRFVVSAGEQEEALLRRVGDALTAMDVHPGKLLPGREGGLRTPHGELHVRRLMVGDLKLEESFTLQREGLGPCRHLGCGLFVPHKSVAAARVQPGGDA
jgi:CRISPR-associated protein Cas6